MTTYIAHTELAPGCHGKPFAPVVSRHRTFEAAKKAARKNDRLVAVCHKTGERFQIDQHNHPRHGAGRFGRGAA